MSAAAALDSERPWFILSRWQQYEGEGRTNLLRVLAIAGYYTVHLTTYLSLAERAPEDQQYHRLVTLIAAAWLFLSLGVLVALQRQYFPAALKYVTSGVDLLLLTAVAWLGNGPQSPVVLGYFVIVAAAGLRFSLPLVWTTTLAAMGGYLALVAAKDRTWFDPIHDTPVAQQLTMHLSLALTGIVLGQVLRRFRSAAEEYARQRSATSPREGAK
jgi:hypothetical protein